MHKHIIDYITDWKNILSHGVAGVLFLLAAIFIPVSLYVKIPVILLLIVFNVYRMQKKKD